MSDGALLGEGREGDFDCGELRETKVCLDGLHYTRMSTLDTGIVT